MTPIPDGIYSYTDGDREIRFRFKGGVVRVEEIVVTKIPIYEGEVEGFTEIDGKAIRTLAKAGGKDIAIRLEDGSLMYCRMFTKVR